MTSLAARVLHAVKTRGLIVGGDRVAVAVSGGADSVALLHLLLEIAPSLEASIVGAAHLNHRLRGAASDDDQAFVAALTRALGLPLHESAEDVAALGRERHVSIEHAGHLARRAFYAGAIASLGATVLATGHTADDQAETVLLRLIRGAGTRGLGGIHPRHGRIVRPLLDTARSETRRYLERRGLAWREDATNDDPSMPRNRVRRELVPLLRSRFSPAVVETLARTADVLRDENAYLAQAATAAAALVVLPVDTGVALDRQRLASIHPALARRVVRDALRAVGGDASAGARHVDQVLRLARSSSRVSRLRLAGVEATRTADQLHLSLRSEGEADGPDRRHEPVAPVALEVPGETELPDFGVTLEARWTAAAVEAAAAGRAPDMVVLAPSAAAQGLFVRSWRPGDRVQPAGRSGRKKLQDLFVDRKVPRHERHSVPVVVDGDGAVVWVVGHAVADGAVPREGAPSVLLLKVKRPGG